MSTEITDSPSADRLREFVLVLEEGSISAASRRLGIPRATLSRRLSTLEAELGVRLLHRGTRRLVPTPAGEQLFARARRIVIDTDEAWAAIRRLDDTPRGPLRVSINLTTNTRTLFTEFARDFPEVRLEVTASDRHVDLIAEGIDVAIRGGEIADPQLIARRLFNDRSVAVASPTYLERRGTPQHPSDLVDHEIIVGFGGTSAPSRTWPRWGGGVVQVPHHHASSDMHLRLQWAIAGLGIAMVPKGVAAADVQAARLDHVLETQVGAPAPLSLVYVDREFQAPQVRVFIDRAIEFFVGARGGDVSGGGLHRSGGASGGAAGG